MSPKLTITRSAHHRNPTKQKIKIKSPEKQFQSRRLRLYQQLDKGFYQNALKTCNQLLNQPGNGQKKLIWIDTKAKLLTILERYQEAIEFLSEQAIESGRLELLEAYCFYKLGQIEKASDVLSNPRITAEEDMVRAKLALESQILFKRGRYAEAKALLEDLLVDSSAGHPEYVDLNANISACESRTSFVEEYIPSQTSLVNIQQLEAAPITSSFFQSHPDFPTTSSRPSKSTQQIGRTKPSKPLDPSRPPPDPNRWLPRREKEINLPKKHSIVKQKKLQDKLVTQGSVSALPHSSDSPPSLKISKQNKQKKKNKK